LRGEYVGRKEGRGPFAPFSLRVLLIPSHHPPTHTHTHLAALARSPQPPQGFASCGSDKAIRLYDQKTGQLYATLDHGDGSTTTGHGLDVFGLAWHNEDPNVSWCWFETAFACSHEGWFEGAGEGGTRHAESVSLELHVRPPLILPLPSPPLSSPATCLSIQVLISGGWDNTVQVWDVRLNRSVRSLFGPYVCGDSLDLKGNAILAGGERQIGR
jgi:WD40 repeat protein